MRGIKKQPTLEQRVLSFIGEHRLIPGGQKLLVAVSGGPDSVCLLHILARLQKELDIKLYVAHLDHQLRGAESEADAAYVADLARGLGIPANIERRDVTAYQSRRHISLEEAAREVRYSFLAKVAGFIGTDRVAVGHTLDDHIETILMHLIRGTGTRGLRGLQPYSRWQFGGENITVIRPLFGISREETGGYCLKHGLMPRIDASNLSLSLFRNRIRHELLPRLEGYNPGVTEALLRLGRIAADDFDFIDAEMAKFWDEIARQQGDTVILNKERFLELPSAIKRHMLRAAIEKLLGGLKDIETRHIEAVIGALTKPAGKRLNLPGGLVFSIEYDRYLLGLDMSGLSPFPALGSEWPLEVPGETSLPGWSVEATVIPPEAMADDAGGYKAYLDLDKTGDRIMVRGRRRGDRFQPLGMEQPKKLGEFMIDAKIPRGWRGQIPLVCSSHHILWVVGWRIDERVKVTEDTRQVLCLEFKRC